MKTPRTSSSSIAPAAIEYFRTVVIPRAGRRELTAIRERVLGPLARDSRLPEEIREEASRLWWLTYDESFRPGKNTLCISGGNEGELYGHRIGIDNSAGLCYAAGRPNNNQDALLFSAIEDEELTVVADGLGGHLSGEKAAKIAVEMIGRVFQDPGMFPLPDFPLSKALEIANDALCFDDDFVLQRLDKEFKTNRSSEVKEFPGATAVAALWKPPILSVASVGDARGYLFRSNGIFYILTPDDGGLLAALSYVVGCAEGKEVSKEDFQIKFGEANGLVIYNALEKEEFVEKGTVKNSLCRGMELIFSRELQMGYGSQAVKEGDIFWQVMKSGVPPKFPMPGKRAESYYRFSELFLFKNAVSNHLGILPFKKPFTCSFKPVKGDILVLSSDGLNYLPLEKFKSVVAGLRDESPEDIAGGLYDATPKKDNITIAVSKF